MSEQIELKRVGGPLTFKQAMSSLLGRGAMVQPLEKCAYALVFRKDELHMVNDPLCDPARFLAEWAHDYAMSHWYIVEEVKRPFLDDVRRAAKERGVEVRDLSLSGTDRVHLEKGGIVIGCVAELGQAYTTALRILESGVFDDN